MKKRLTKKEWLEILELARSMIGSTHPKEWDYLYNLVERANKEIASRK